MNWKNIYVISFTRETQHVICYMWYRIEEMSHHPNATLSLSPLWIPFTGVFENSNLIIEVCMSKNPYGNLCISYNIIFKFSFIF